MSFVQIPLSNTLRLVRTDNQDSLLPNFSNRLLHQEDYNGYYDIPYAQKISSSDNILVQYSTDLTPVTAEIYDITDTLIIDKSADISLIYTGTTFNIYDLLFTLATEGYYYLKMTFGTGETQQVWESEIFQIDGFDTSKIVKIEYNTSENDGITYLSDETFVIRIEGRIVEYNPGQNKETYTNYNESLVNLNSYPKRGFRLEYGPLPRYMIEKLNLALGHEVFKVNDVAYQSDDGADAELIKDGEYVTNIYKGTVQLQEVDYENYLTAADEAAVDTFRILIDSSDGLLVVVDEGVNYNVKYKD